MTADKRIPVHVEGKVVRCSDHWHARVDCSGREPVLSGACLTEEDADEVLLFVQKVVMTLVAAGGGMSYVSDGTEKLQ